MSPDDPISQTPDPPRGSAQVVDVVDRVFVVVFLLLIGVPPLTQAILDLRRDGWPQALDVLTVVPSQEALRRIEAEMERRSWVAGLARGPWASAVDEAVERGGAQVVFGRRGWLFYRPALRFVAGRDLRGVSKRGGTTPEAVFDAITDFHRQLDERGKRLLFVPVPTKVTLYPEVLSDRLDAPTAVAEAPNDPAVAELLVRLTDAGVEVVDPLPVLLDAKLNGSDVFLPTDTHWNWFGLVQVVEQVVRRIGFDPPPKPAFDQRQVEMEAHGDLHGMLGHADDGERKPIPPLRSTITQVADAPDGTPPIRTPSSVLVIGDSSVLVFSEPSLGLGRRAGFAERLAFSLGQPVDRLATPAGGATRIRRLLALEAHRLAAAEVVVWVMTQRDLRFAAEGWERVEMPSVEAAGAGGSPGEPTLPPLPTGKVLAEVVATSQPPERADYADCLVIVRYRLLEPAPSDTESTFDVAHLGWKDFAPTPAATLAPGDIVELDLVELPADRGLDRTCWVDDVGLVRSPLWARSHVRR